MAVKMIVLAIVVCCFYHGVVGEGVEILNARPIVGILSQELELHRYPPGNFTSYIAASYVKAVEASGGRTVPIMIGKSREYYKELMGKINGVLFPGGNIALNDTNGYSDAGEYIFEIAKQMNDAGDYFPLFGTCQGFQFFVYLASKKDLTSLTHCLGLGNMPILFSKDSWTSKMFSPLSDESRSILRNENSTIHSHRLCVTQKTLEQHELTTNWSATSKSFDLNQVEFVSTLEHRSYPFFAVQFHPEKTSYEWTTHKNFTHAENYIKVNRYFMDFFLHECRKNFHSFKDEEEENLYLMYNYSPYFTGAHRDSGMYYLFTQTYFF